MAGLRTRAEIYAAGLADGAGDPPLTQQQADQCAALLAPWLPQMEPAAA